MSEISQERIQYHELMQEFIALVPNKAIVYDIGKSIYHDYKGKFKGRHFQVIDMDPDKAPDVVLNIEGLNEANIDQYIEKADALLCNGVIEQCNDPMQMIRSCSAILKMDGLVLFGFCSVGYPIHDLDRFRFTEQGSRFAIKRCGFTILKTVTVCRQELESYVYVMARKTTEV